MSAEEKEILSKLLVDEKEVLKRLVDKATKILKLDKKSGKTLLIAPRGRLTDKDVVFSSLLGHYFSSKLGLLQKDMMTPDELAQETGLSRDIVAARAADLIRERAVERIGRGEYKVSYGNVERALDDILEKIE